MPVWSVDIVSGSNGPATFVAQNQPTAPVGTVFVDPGDIVSWNNTTKQPHSISLLADPTLPKDDPKNPGYVLPGEQTPAWIVPAPNPAAPANYPYICLIETGANGVIQAS